MNSPGSAAGYLVKQVTISCPQDNMMSENVILCEQVIVLYTHDNNLCKLVIALCKQFTILCEQVTSAHTTQNVWTSFYLVRTK